MSKEIWTLDIELMTQFANQVREVVIKQLANEGIIPHSERVLEDYVVVIHKPGILGRAMRKVFWKGDGVDGAAVVTLLKVVGPVGEHK